jgi:hypothetical protein
MQELTNTFYETSEQHKNISNTRVSQDRNDTDTVLSSLRQISPFAEEMSLRNIATGVVANKDVNVDQFYAHGESVIKKMQGCDVFRYTLKRSEKVKTLATKTNVKIDGDITIDPALLFQRLMVLANSNNTTLSDCIDFELCSYPPVLFESTRLLLKPDKPKLTKAIVEFVKGSVQSLPVVPHDTNQYVLDGGSLLHRIDWPKNSTYLDISSCYVRYVVNKFGKCTIVFDGYPEAPTTKDNTHKRRVGTAVSPRVEFENIMVFTGKKYTFLKNRFNKQKIVNMVALELEKEGCRVFHAYEDGDVDIVCKAIEYSYLHDTTVVGEDTDLLVLLLYHLKPNSKTIYFRNFKSF